MGYKLRHLPINNSNRHLAFFNQGSSPYTWFSSHSSREGDVKEEIYENLKVIQEFQFLVF